MIGKNSPKGTTIVLALAATLSLLSFNASANLKEFLDDYENIVSVYEDYANKEKLCTDDMMKLNVEVIPKLMPLSQKAQMLQGQLSPVELKRYMDVMNRYTNALMKLGPKMSNVTC